MNFSILRDKLFWMLMYQEGIQTEWFRDYQENARIYLDEYEVEEVDLRVNFDTSLLMKRFMVKE